MTLDRIPAEPSRPFATIDMLRISQIHLTGGVTTMADEPESILKLRRALGRRLAEVRKAAGLTQERLGHKTGCDRTYIGRLEFGERAKDRDFWVVADKVCNAEGVLVAAFEALEVAIQDRAQAQREAELVQARARTEQFRSEMIARAPAGALASLDRSEHARRSLDDVLTAALSDATLNDWETTAISHGLATRHRPATELLEDLTCDLIELREDLARCRTASAARRLTKVAAQMSGLMVLTLCKLDRRSEVRGWARTARKAAIEAGDPATHAWVLAQEAYGHYYAEDLQEAISVAQRAQEIAPRQPCVGAVLAAALEARARALQGQTVETYAALDRAEALLAGLQVDDLVPSAFGYNEASLRFHAGNALTHLGDTKAAWVAQERALQLVAPDDYMDNAFTRLDRAVCLARDGDASLAASSAADTLLALTDAQRQGIITVRAQQVIQAIPNSGRTLPPVRDLHDLLQMPEEPKG